MAEDDWRIWWPAALASEGPVVTLRDWGERGGEAIVMNEAAMLEMIAFGLGASYAEAIRELFPDWKG